MAKITIEVRIEAPYDKIEEATGYNSVGIGEIAVTFEDPIREALDAYKESPLEGMDINIVTTGWDDVDYNETPPDPEWRRFFAKPKE